MKVFFDHRIFCKQTRGGPSRYFVKLSEKLNLMNINAKIFAPLHFNEFLKNKILASNIIYVSISHTDKILKIYFEKLEKIFKKISIMTKKQLKEKVLNWKVYNPMSRIN